MIGRRKRKRKAIEKKLSKRERKKERKKKERKKNVFNRCPITSASKAMNGKIFLDSENKNSLFLWWTTNIYVMDTKKSISI